MSLAIHSAPMEDIPLLRDHHCRMFSEIRELSKEPLSPEKLRLVGEAYAEKLENHLGRTCFAWVARTGGRVTGSAAVSEMVQVPVPEDPQTRIAYLHSVFVEPDFRNLGLAKRLVEEALSFCGEKGICRMELHASPAGLPVYQTLGFAALPAAMRRWIRNGVS